MPREAISAAAATVKLATTTRSDPRAIAVDRTTLDSHVVLPSTRPWRAEHALLSAATNDVVMRWLGHGRHGSALGPVLSYVEADRDIESTLDGGDALDVIG